MNISLKTIKNLLQSAEELETLVKGARKFVLDLDLDHITTAQYQQSLKYLVDILTIFHRNLEE